MLIVTLHRLVYCSFPLRRSCAPGLHACGLFATCPQRNFFFLFALHWNAVSRGRRAGSQLSTRLAHPLN